MARARFKQPHVRIVLQGRVTDEGHGASLSHLRRTSQRKQPLPREPLRPAGWLSAWRTAGSFLGNEKSIWRVPLVRHVRQDVILEDEGCTTDVHCSIANGRKC